MDPRTKESLLWGAVGSLAFLVLAQGYQLLVAPLDAVPVVGTAVVVFALVTGLAHRLHDRLAAARRPPENERS